MPETQWPTGTTLIAMRPGVRNGREMMIQQTTYIDGAARYSVIQTDGRRARKVRQFDTLTTAAAYALAYVDERI
jgi:hypothetical protein